MQKQKESVAITRDEYNRVLAARQAPKSKGQKAKELLGKIGRGAGHIAKETLKAASKIPDRTIYTVRETYKQPEVQAVKRALVNAGRNAAYSPSFSAFDTGEVVRYTRKKNKKKKMEKVKRKRRKHRGMSVPITSNNVYVPPQQPVVSQRPSEQPSYSTGSGNESSDNYTRDENGGWRSYP